MVMLCCVTLHLATCSPNYICCATHVSGNEQQVTAANPKYTFLVKQVTTDQDEQTHLRSPKYAFITLGAVNNLFNRAIEKVYSFGMQTKSLLLFFLFLFFLLLLLFFAHYLHNELCSASYFPEAVNSLTCVFGIIVPTNL